MICIPTEVSHITQQQLIEVGTKHDPMNTNPGPMALIKIHTPNSNPNIR